MALTPYEWRVLRDLDKHGSVERGAATNQAIEVLSSSGYLMASESHRKLITAKGYEAIAAGEPKE